MPQSDHNWLPYPRESSAPGCRPSRRNSASSGHPRSVASANYVHPIAGTLDDTVALNARVPLTTRGHRILSRVMIARSRQYVGIPAPQIGICQFPLSRELTGDSLRALLVRPIRVRNSLSHGSCLPSRTIHGNRYHSTSYELLYLHIVVSQTPEDLDCVLTQQRWRQRLS